MSNYSKDQIIAVWEKAFPQANNNPSVFRKDYAGAWIRFEDFGNRNSDYGWEIDHLKPVSKGGTDDISNLYPLFWKNNVTKGNDYPEWQTGWSAEGVSNKEVKKMWRV